MLCATYDTKTQLLNVLSQVSYAFPFVYNQNIPEFIKADKNFALHNIILNSLIKGIRVKRPAVNKRTFLFTKITNQKLINFAKTDKFNKDLYSDFVAPGLKSSLYTTTWQNGSGGKMNSSCPSNGIKVLNNKCVFLENNKNFTWKTTQDHSKWAVSADKKYACICDINRVESQFKRGGNFIVFFLFSKYEF